MWYQYALKTLPDYDMIVIYYLNNMYIFWKNFISFHLNAVL